MKIEIDNTQSRTLRGNIRKERNGTINNLHKLVKEQEKQKVENEIEQIENSKEDSTRMFHAIKSLQRTKPKENLLIQTEDGTLTADKAQCK